MSASRRSRTRSRSSGASRRNTNCTTGCGSPTARSSPPRPWPTATSPTAFCPTRLSILMDEASARLRMTIDSKPEELDELDRRIVQLKIEREALKKETDPASRERLQRLEQELAQLEQQSAELTAQW